MGYSISLLAPEDLLHRLVELIYSVQTCVGVVVCGKHVPKWKRAEEEEVGGRPLRGPAGEKGCSLPGDPAGVFGREQPCVS